VGGGDKVDVVAVHLLQSDHDPGHVRRGDGFSPAQVADVVVLTKNTPEITVGQEDSARSMLTDERGFFTKVREGARDHQVGSGLTVAQLSLHPVNPALPGTELAILKNLSQKFNPSGQLPCACKFNIRGDKGHFKNTSN
jgi:hypothetical protein